MQQQSDTSLPGRKGPIIRKLFARISPRYDLVNHLLSIDACRFVGSSALRVLERGWNGTI